MRIDPTWLREFVNLKAADRQLADDLTLAGVAVEGGDVVAVLGGARPEDLLAALVRADLGVRGFVVEQPSLEEQFVRLTGEGFDVSG